MVAGSNSAFLVQVNHAKLCSFCDAELHVEEGVVIYDRHWYHNGCWKSFEKQQEAAQVD